MFEVIKRYMRGTNVIYFLFVFVATPVTVTLQVSLLEYTTFCGRMSLCFDYLVNILNYETAEKLVELEHPPQPHSSKLMVFELITVVACHFGYF